MKRSLLMSIVLLAAGAVGFALWQPPAPTLPIAPPDPTAVDQGAMPTAGSTAVTGDAPTAMTRAPDDEARTPVLAAAANSDAAQGVFGRVVDERGRPIAQADAFLIESASNDPIHRFMSLAHAVPTLAAAAVQTDVGGAFRLGLRSANDRQYEVCLQSPGCASERIGELRIHDGEWLDLGDLVLRPGATIRGRVTVAGTDLPAPGAVVRIESGDPFFDLGPAQLPGWRDRRSASVDANGDYELRGAPRHGLFRLLAAAPGFGRQIREQVELADGRPIQVDFALPRGLSIAGTLVTGGRPLTSVRIEVFAKTAEPAFFATIATDGTFFVHGLREGPHLLKIEAEGYQPVAIDNVAAGSDDVVVELEARGSARVTVRDADGVLLRQYRLAVRRYFPDSGQIAAVRDMPDRVIRLAAGEAQATIDGLDTGTFAFQVLADGSASTLSPPFTIDAEHREAEVEMTMVRGGRLIGSVVDQAGGPIAGATVATQPTGADDDNPLLRVLANLTPDRITRASASTDASGRFELSNLAHADYQLQIVHHDHCRSIRSGIEIRADAAQTLPPIVLQRGTAVRGRALIDGMPTAQVLVVLTPDPAASPDPGPREKTLDETTLGRVEAVTNIDGSFELPRRVPPGAYELRGVLQLGNAQGADPFQKLLQMKKSTTRVTVQPGQLVAEFELRLASDH